MQEIGCKLSRTAAVVVIFLAACVGSAWGQHAGIPWQVNDVAACVASDTCYVLRIHSDNSIQFLDSLSDGLSGGISGVGFNNTLHLLTTNDAGGNASNVVEYSIASVNPFDGTIPNSVHAPIGTFSSAGNNAKALAINNFGHIFVANAGTGAQQPSIVELNAAGSSVANSVFSFPASGDCATAPNTLSSLDLSADGSAIYVTAGDGVIRKVSLAVVSNIYTLAGATCAKFADFGSGVHLYGIKDIPAHALPATCGSSVTASTSCPTDETILVVATGSIDPDAGEVGEGTNTDANDTFNICTDDTSTAATSCALLLKTTGDGLTAQPWAAGNPYVIGNSILDTHLHVQSVKTDGRSGMDEPAWNSNGDTIDNAVKWKDTTPAGWMPGHSYSTPGTWPLSPSVAAIPGTYLIDTGNNLQTVTKTGISEPAINPPSWQTSGVTIDGLVWTDQGAVTPWTPLTHFDVGTLFVDAHGSVQKVTTAGSSTTPSQPTWNQSAGMTTTDGLQWVNLGRPVWQQGSYPPNAAIIDSNGLVQQTLTGGTTDQAQPTWNEGPNQTTTDGGVTWTSLGTPSWATTTYQVGAVVIDNTPLQNLEQVFTAGTSGAGQPTWNTTVSALTPDNAVVWTNQGGPVTAWTTGHPFALNTFITEGSSPQHVQKATEAGTSGPSITFNHGPGATTEDNAVEWTVSNPNPARAADKAYVLGAIVVDSSDQHVELVTLAGTTGPGVNFTFKTDGSEIVDGLQWTALSTPSIAARYPVTGTNTLQSLALDPLVRDCISNPCTSSISATNYRNTSNFWMADSAHPTVYKLDFTTGAITPPSTGFDLSNCTFYTKTGTTNPCSGVTRITGFGVYASESASQPGLASVVSNLQLGSAQAPNFTATATILQNTITSTLYSNTASPPALTNISLYASIVDQSSCFNDPTVGSIPCTITVPNSSNAVVWKLDVPLGGSTNVASTALPTNETLNTAFVAPGTTNSTDVFVDEQFDDTTFVGSDPGTRTVSVHSLHNVGGIDVGASGCKFSSPLPNGCYKLNRTTLNFTFSCSLLSPTQVASLKPVLSLVKKTNGQAPQFINVSGADATNGKPAFRYNATSNFWTYQLNLTGFAAGTYLGTAFDLSQQVQSFTTQNFRLDNTCK